MTGPVSLEREVGSHDRSPPDQTAPDAGAADVEFEEITSSDVAAGVG